MSVDTWIGIIGIAIGVIGTLWALWAYYRTGDHRIVRYAQVRRDLISEEAFSTPPGRLISVDGEPIRRLYREYILIHSAGNKSIRFLEELNAITLKLPENTRVLAAGVYRNDDPANLATAEVDGNQANLRFDYLRSNDAIVFFVDHEVAEESSTQASIHERERDAVRRGNNKTMLVYANRFVFGMLSAMLWVIFLFLLVVPLDIWLDLRGFLFDRQAVSVFVDAASVILLIAAMPFVGFFVGILAHKVLIRPHTGAMRAYLFQVSLLAAAESSRDFLP